MIQSRRAAVADAFDRAPSPHPGLLLDRGLPEQGGGEGRDVHPKARHLAHVASCTAGSLYADAYTAWREALHARPRVCAAEMEVSDGLIVGLAGRNVLEAGITLHHTYGVPLIPGSGLKGLARHHLAALHTHDAVASSARLEQLDAHNAVLFGVHDNAGHTTYFDAWYVSGSAPNDQPFALDTITVHHPRYYTGGTNRRAPSDFDDPNPVGFVRARGRYLIAVDGPTLLWARFALDLVVQALVSAGAGGKTASGYGRLTPTGASIRYVAAQATERAAAMRHPVVNRVAAMSAQRVKPEIDQIAATWRQLDDVAARAAIARAVLRKLDEAQVEARWRQGKAWVEEMRQYVAAHEGDA